jgi:tetratricopeptide (TPR) repeat protein
MQYGCIRGLAVCAALILPGVDLNAQLDDGMRLLAEGDQLAWLKNWQAAEPFFAKSEAIFHESGDKRNELYARISRIRGQLPSHGLFETSTYLASVLDDPLTKKDARLRLRCLTVKGDVDLDFDTALAARDWTEALSIAKDLEDPSWVNRANGELGIISFVQGDYRNGTVRVMGALSQAKKPNDIGAQIRYLTLVGDGLIQLQRNEQAIAMFDQALAVAQTIPELGQPVMTYAGKAQALAALGRTAEAKKLLESVFEISHQRSAPFLDARRALKNKVGKASNAILGHIAKRVSDLRVDDPLLLHLMDACANIRDLEARRKELVAKAVILPPEAEANDDFLEAVRRLGIGKSAFGLPFGKGEARKLITSVTVLGSAPGTSQDWALIQRVLDWRMDAKKSIARWNSVATEFDIEPQNGSLDAACRAMTLLQEFIEDTHQLVFGYDAKMPAEIEKVFGRQVADRVWDAPEATLKAITEALQAHCDKGRLAYAMGRVDELVMKLDGCSGIVVDDVRRFLTEALGNKSHDEAALRKAWLSLQSELSRVVSLRSALVEIASASDLVEAAGGKKWAVRLRTEAAESDYDAVTPSSWREAWNWRCAVICLDKIDGHQELRDLFAQRKMLTMALARAYQDLVAEKTWLGVYHNSPPAIRQALQAYLNSIQALGAGTGVRAIRHRRTAREAMLSAYRAVPCWVMPEWRICETIPPELGLFELVVIDEASQSDIWALPALLRGKKLLVVGDHKQVSPSAVGVPEEKIKELRDRFLADQPFGSEMTPDKSIYDLARVVFAGNSVMLREHFRCVPAIIEYSNREFYEGDIKPLRLPHCE